MKSSQDHTVLVVLDLHSEVSISLARSTVRAHRHFQTTCGSSTAWDNEAVLGLWRAANIYACGTTITAGTTIGCSADSSSSMLMQFRRNHVNLSFGCRGLNISNRSPEEFIAYVAPQTDNQKVISS
jgi:hypothetical protein